MGLSKSTRILILLSIDSAFFFLELIVGQSKCALKQKDGTSLLINVYPGYAVHSLALVADSFHMVSY